MGIENTVSGGMLVSNRDTSKMFLFGNSFEDGTVDNGDGDDLVLAGGTLMGRVAATGMLVPLSTGASDGSQYPVGVLATNYTIAYGEEKAVKICTAGEIDSSFLVIPDGESLDDVIDGRQLRDRIGADTVGLILRDVAQLSDFDNE